MNRRMDLTGQVLGHWTVIEPDGGKHWKCKCACGTVKSVASGHLVSGRSTNCGCERTKKMVAAAKAASTKHGMYGTKTYWVWKAMRSRCDNPNNMSYPRYGAKGITYDPAWKDFEAFYADMGEAPEGLSLERKDNSRGYSRANCRWATAEEQNRNKGDNALYSDGTESLPLSVWEERFGIARKAIQANPSFYGLVRLGRRDQQPAA